MIELTLEHKNKDGQVINYNFNPKNKDLPTDNIFAIIGNNGSGKTKLIKDIFTAISNENVNNEEISIKESNISKAIHLSFNSLDEPLKSIGENLAVSYKDIKNKNLIKNNLEIIKEDKNKATLFWLEVYKYNFIFQDVFKDYANIYYSDFEEYKEIIDIELTEGLDGKDIFSKYNFYKSILDIYDKSSPGEKVVILGLTYIIANINNQTVVLLDEPELYLHPQMISIYINSIINIINKYDTICILTTNSPIILQEMNHHNVYKCKNSNGLVLESIKQRTFGENLSNITDDVFKFNIKSTNFYNTLSNKKSEELKEILNSDYIGSEGRFYIRLLISEKEDF